MIFIFKVYKKNLRVDMDIDRREQGEREKRTMKEGT